jgi:putative acetyltransferase
MTKQSKKIFSITKDDYPRLLEIWESSVRATHHFLKESDIQFFKPLVVNAFSDVNIISCKDSFGIIVGFLGIANNKIEMLFIDASYRGKGIGKKLTKYAIRNLKATKLDVNEQNPQAVEFYKHIGFKIIGRSELDEMGKSFPLLHMELK